MASTPPQTTFRRQGLLQGHEHGRQANEPAAGLGRVCFRSASSDADGYHSLVQTASAGYDLPPCATVTLEKVEQPGEWEVRGLKVQRRLLTVRVTWNEKWWWW